VADRLLNEKEAASLIGLSPAWFQRKRWEGGGPVFVKLDRAVRYRERDLLAWIETHAGFRSTSEYQSRQSADHQSTSHFVMRSKPR
jgi:predicted DNA-binding transcriptional regulator AlpA